MAIMTMLLNNLRVRISNEEMVKDGRIKKADSSGIIKYIKSYPTGSTLTYYIDYNESDEVLDHYNDYFMQRSLPVFDTRQSKHLKNERGYSYINAVSYTHLTLPTT